MISEFLHGFKVPAKLYWDASYQRILDTQETVRNLSVQYWLEHAFPRWTWWFLLFWTIFPLLIWWKFTSRQRFVEISFFGVMVSLCSGILDVAGIFNLLWSYPYGLIPFLPNFFPIDYVVIPCVFMLIYQKYPGWKQFLIATTLISTVLSLAFDPVLVWLNLYQPLSWQYYYSVPVFVFLVSFCKLVTRVICAQDRKYGGFLGGE